MRSVGLRGFSFQAGDLGGRAVAPGGVEDSSRPADGTVRGVRVEIVHAQRVAQESGERSGLGGLGVGDRFQFGRGAAEAPAGLCAGSGIGTGQVGQPAEDVDDAPAGVGFRAGHQPCDGVDVDGPGDEELPQSVRALVVEGVEDVDDVLLLSPSRLDVLLQFAPVAGQPVLGVAQVAEAQRRRDLVVEG